MVSKRFVPRHPKKISVSNNTNKLISFVLKYTISLMVFTYQEILKKYGNERQIRNALSRREIYSVGRGFYSDESGKGKDYFFKRYPSIVFTGKTAFYHYGLTDAAPEVVEVASPLGSTRIREKEARQSFQVAAFFPLGKLLWMAYLSMIKSGCLLNYFGSRRDSLMTTTKKS